MVKGRMGWCVSSDDYCVIGNVLYSASEAVIRWYDSEKRRWRDLLGLVGLPKIITGDDVRGTIRLGDYGGKMVVSWGTTLWPYYMKIWCAEIALERRPDTSEIWGKVDWFDELLKVDIYSQVEKVLSITL
ncbi:unnamed protein product [Eruca vesicaria subsp. sativa]|uniref:FKB95-like N-terminal Kelch domain-containing protein n=1 Tax=Eruca vesicaria subsp. sativa TaxID=29727 RepID=A0ABC8K5A0_ERUVS|nr:unnamed protein product [Eruca vesicaria subsp. sativa]